MALRLQFLRFAARAALSQPSNEPARKPVRNSFGWLPSRPFPMACVALRVPRRGVTTDTDFPDA